MKTHTCPNCGHVSQVEPQQARAGKALWAHMTPAERSAEMSRRRMLGMARQECARIPDTLMLVKAIEKELEQQRP